MTDTKATTVTVQADLLLAAVQNAAHFASTDDTLPTLTCIRLVTRDGELLVQATDRYVASREVTGKTEGELDVLVYAKDAVRTAKSLAAVLKASNSQHLADKPQVTVDVPEGTQFARFTLTGHIGPDTALTAATLDGEFPRAIDTIIDDAMKQDFAAIEAANTEIRRKKEAGEPCYTSEHDLDSRQYRFAVKNMDKLTKVVTPEFGRRDHGSLGPVMDFRFTASNKPAAVTIGERFTAVVMSVRPEGR